MYTGPLVFTQVMDFMPLKTFQRCVERYQGNFSVKNFTCLDQFRIMAFAQLTYRESLRDIEACLRAQNNRLYHIGICSKVSVHWRKRTRCGTGASTPILPII